MHHVAVVLEKKLVGDANAAERCDAARIVPPEVEQHQVLGALLRVGQKLFAEALVLLRRFSARSRAGDRTDGHVAIAHANQDLRARTDDRKTVEVEEIEETARGSRGEARGRGKTLEEETGASKRCDSTT